MADHVTGSAKCFWEQLSRDDDKLPAIQVGELAVTRSSSIMRLQTVFAVALLVTGCGGFVPLPATAQESRATPETEAAIVLPYTARAEDCHVEPRPVAFFTDAATTVLATPIPAQPVSPDLPAATPAATQLGVAADAETTAEVVALMAESEACVATGDILRRLNLFTDAGAEEDFVLGFGYAIQNERRAGNRPLTTADEVLAWVFAAPQTGAPPVTLVAVDDVRVLPDGRVTAVVTRSIPEFGEVTLHVVMERAGDDLRIVTGSILSLPSDQPGSNLDDGTPVP